jgi:tetratricopeptide (TPR) repeat protein
VNPIKSLQLGPELWGAPIAGGQNGFLSNRETPLFALFGLRFRAGSWVFGGAVGPGLTHAPGVSPRVILNVAYEPEVKRVRYLRDEPAAVPPERPTEGPVTAPPQQIEEAYPAAPTAAAVPPVVAPERSEAEIRAEARAAFTRGVAAYDEARYPDAVAEFSRAYELLPHISVLRNLAHSELMSGRLDDACAHFVRWRAEVKDPSPKDMKQATEGMARACP